MEEILERGGHWIAMSLAAYDEGLLNYLKETLSFPNVINSAESQAWDNFADEDLVEGNREKKKAEVTLPMVSFWRIANPLTHVGGGNFAMRRRGRIADKDEDSGTAIRWRSLPISLSYQITIWSDRRREVDDIFRELIMYLVTDNPHISIKLEGMETPEEFMLEVVDTDSSTDVDSFDNRGRIYTQHILVDVTDAQLFFSREVSLTKNIPLRTVPLQDL